MTPKGEIKQPLTKRASAVNSFLDPVSTEVKEPVIAKKAEPDNSENIVRATFLMDKEKVKLLKDYAYIEGLQIKEVADQMITEFLNNHFDNSKAVNGRKWKE